MKTISQKAVEALAKVDCKKLPLNKFKFEAKFINEKKVAFDLNLN